MKFDLTAPCLNCPFRNDETRIKFACRERAEEIEELAYRQGFVCHKHGETDDDDDEGGIDFKADGTSQHCAGALILFMNEGYNGNVPFEHLDEDEQDRITARLKFDAPVFESIEEFFEANTNPEA